MNSEVDEIKANVLEGLYIIEEACHDARTRIEKSQTSVDSVKRRFLTEVEHGITQVNRRGDYRD